MPTSTPTAAPGTVLRDCKSNNNGTLGSNWKASSVHAGPVWFIYARLKNNPLSSQRLTVGKVTASAAPPPARASPPRAGGAGEPTRIRAVEA